MVDETILSERDICTKYITLAITAPGWDLHAQVREEVYFTKGPIHVHGRVVKRGEAQRADYILYFKPNLPPGIVEAKDNNHSLGDGMQQALGYSDVLDVPFAFSTTLPKNLS